MTKFKNKKFNYDDEYNDYDYEKNIREEKKNRRKERMIKKALKSKNLNELLKYEEE